MPMLLDEDYEYKLPIMHKVRQVFRRETISDIEGTVRAELSKDIISGKIKPGMRVAVAVGSRGIRNLFTIVRTTVDFLKEQGAEPFIVSAMGSHGGGNEEGQREVLEGYGITEAHLGVPVVTTVDVIKLGETEKHTPVYFDRAASEADMVVPINRIKLHTDFVGPLQSGLCKMLVIGLGNQKGCSAIHEEDPETFAATIESAARIILEKIPVGFGVAVMENAYDETTHIEAIAGENFVEREKELVKRTRENMPFIQIDKADVIVVEEIGKNVSGAGFDPNILGRSSVLKTYVLHIPEFQKMVLLDLTDESHGNAIGLGAFDVITQNVFEKMDMESTYANSIACKCVDDVKIPLIARDEDEAVRVALKACRNVDRENARIVKIKNTLELEFISVSDALLDEVERNPNLILEAD
ncbi:MAG: lactate racemase domain-containing protein [Wujia sp.]